MSSLCISCAYCCGLCILRVVHLPVDCGFKSCSPCGGLKMDKILWFIPALFSYNGKMLWSIHILTVLCFCSIFIFLSYLSTIVCLFALFHLALIVSVIHRFMASDISCGISLFKSSLSLFYKMSYIIKSKNTLKVNFR
jgi:hypothetical protein